MILLADFVVLTRNLTRKLQKERELQGIATVSSIADLPVAYATSVSIITPPKVRSRMVVIPVIP